MIVKCESKAQGARAIKFTGDDNSYKEICEFLDIEFDIKDKPNIVKDVKISNITTCSCLSLSKNDWIVKYDNGYIERLSEKKFNERFTVVEESGLLNWAKNEVKLGVKQERDVERKEAEKSHMPYDENGFSYGGACYESALKAFKSLYEDNHSIMSIGFTKNALLRLIDSKPLTAIEDTDDIWESCGSYEKTKMYQCKRLSSLFKYVTTEDNGEVKINYNDQDRAIGFTDTEKFGFTGSRISSIINKLFPIKMPYYPYDKKFIVYYKNDETDIPYKILTPWDDIIYVKDAETFLVYDNDSCQLVPLDIDSYNAKNKEEEGD